MESQERGEREKERKKEYINSKEYVKSEGGDLESQERVKRETEKKKEYVNFNDLRSTKQKNRLMGVMDCLRRENSLSKSEIMEQLNFKKRTLDKDILYLRAIGFLTFKGSPKTGRYHLSNKGKAFFESNIK